MEAMTEAPDFRIPPPAFLDDPALRKVLAALPEARIVGGAVRDALAGPPVVDVDLATPRHPEAVAAALSAAGIRSLPTGLDHGTITALADGKSFEVTTLRRDEATDGRHATVAFTTDWREDAARRDFTINAMSMTPDGGVHDYFGGRADLAAGRVRFVGEPGQRIAEDFLRILRFLRFHARYGRGEPDGVALAAIAAGVPGLARLSAERVWSELRRILAAPDPRAAVALMARLGVLRAVLPESADCDGLAELVARAAPAEPLLRLAALLSGETGAGAIEALAERLRLSGAERDRLLALRAPPVPDPTMDDAALRRLLADEPADILIERAWLAEDDRSGWAQLRARLAAMPRPRFPLEGRDALALGMAPGPAVGEALRAVRAWWRRGGCVADAMACRAELARRVAG